jgi:hypothetical protein
VLDNQHQHPDAYTDHRECADALEPHRFYSRRQLLANAAIAASRVGS